MFRPFIAYPFYSHLNSWCQSRQGKKVFLGPGAVVRHPCLVSPFPFLMVYFFEREGIFPILMAKGDFAAKMRTAISDRAGLIEAIRTQYVLEWHGTHGWDHWMRVLETGQILVADNGADMRIVELFALLHDSCRQNDGHDPQHGPRAALFAEELCGVFFKLGKEAMEVLLLAIRDHTRGYIHPDPTIQVCWDADRLDLPRVNIQPDPGFFGTRAAKRLLEFSAAERKGP